MESKLWTQMKIVMMMMIIDVLCVYVSLWYLCLFQRSHEYSHHKCSRNLCNGHHGLGTVLVFPVVKIEIH